MIRHPFTPPTDLPPLEDPVFPVTKDDPVLEGALQTREERLSDRAIARFSLQSVSALQQGYAVLFSQVENESNRIERIQTVLELLQNRILDPDVIDHLDSAQSLQFFSALHQVQRGSTTMILDLVKTVQDAKRIRFLLAQLMETARRDAKAASR